MASTLAPGPAAAQAAAAPPRRRPNLVKRLLAHRHGRFWLGVIGCVGALLVWEIGARVIDDPLYLPTLGAIWNRFIELSESGELATHIRVSAIEYAYGCGLAIVVGIAVGAAIALSRVVGGLLDPLLSAAYATPIVALAPLFILWFGIGVAGKVAVIFSIAVIPIIINTTAGIRATDPKLIAVGRSFGASRGQIFRRILCPYASSFIVSGLRLGLGKGLIGVVVGEMFASREGVGQLIIHSGQVFDTAGAFVGVGILAFAGVVATGLLQAIEHRLAPWRSETVQVN